MTQNHPPQGELNVKDKAFLEAALSSLKTGKDAWATMSLDKRIELLEKVIDGIRSVAFEWVQLSCKAKGIDAESPLAAEEWLAGPYTTLRNLRLLKISLVQLSKGQPPKLPKRPFKSTEGRWRVPVYPTDIYDSLFFMGTRAEVWLDENANPDDFAKNLAHSYLKDDPSAGAISLVLSAGNVSSIGPLDAVHKLFHEKQVVLVKSHPVNDYLQPLLEKAFAPLITGNFIRFVKGGAKEGDFLCNHPDIADIHITGSDKTHDAIVFGPDADVKKATGTPRLQKKITSELGNVSPLIVVPGPWTSADLAYQAENIASSLANNAGFNCNATRVVLTHAQWPLRQELLTGIRRTFASLPARPGYYPGAKERFQQFIEVHPEAETFGGQGSVDLPWTFIPGVSPTQPDDICFQKEAFCSLFCEAPMDAETMQDFVQKAVEFANTQLWGSLNVTLLVHPKTMKDPEMGNAVTEAIRALRFGTVSINHWAAVGFAMGSTPWGAYPGHSLYDIRSGIGVVHNTYMLEHVEKAVISGPFRAFPKPSWFVTCKNGRSLGEKLVQFEHKPSPWKIPGIFWSALRG